MNKKQSFSIGFTLFLVVSVFLPLINISPAIISDAPQQFGGSPENSDLDLGVKNSSKIEEGTASGTGNDQTLTMTCEKNATLTNYNSTDDFNVTTGDWNVTQAYLNFTDIFTQKFTKEVAGSGSSYDYDVKTYPTTMRLNVSSTTSLQEFSAYLRFTSISYTAPFHSKLSILIYNATFSNGREEPFAFANYLYYEQFTHENLGISTGDSGPIWVNLSLSSAVDLDITETINNTFFICLYHSDSGVTYWSGNTDSTTSNNSFRENVGWQALRQVAPPTDKVFKYKANLTNYVPTAEEINMKVNNSNILNGNDIGNGDTTLSGNYQGTQINFDVSADCDINYTVNWTCDFQNQTSIPPGYVLNSGGDSEWNMTFAGNFLEDANNQEINVTIGSDWENATIYNNSVSYDNVVKDESNDWVFIDNITTNGSWVVSSSQENYGNTIQLYQYGSLTDVTSSKLINMSDTIYVNASLSGATSGEANLTIFDPSGSVVVNKSNNNTISGTLITFADVDFSSVATTNGTYNIQVLWWNGSAVSLIQIDLEIINRTQLDLLSDGQITGQHYIGDSINISVYLNDTSKGSGSPCGDADISIEIFNLTDQSTVETISSGSISEGILGNGYYNYSLDTSTYINGSYEIRVNSTKPGAFNNSLNTSTFSLVFNTSFFMQSPGTIDPLYYYPDNLSLQVNFSKWINGETDTDIDALVQFQVNGSTPEAISFSGSNLYEVTLNITDYPFLNQTAVRNVSITTSKMGYENQSIQFYWNTTEKQTSLTLDNIAGVDLGTTYWNNSIYLKYSYNTTSPNNWIQNPNTITLQVDSEIPVNLNVNGSNECYDIQLNSTDYEIKAHTIQVIAQKYGNQNWTRNYTWTTEIANTRIESYVINGASVANNSGIQTYYPNNITISFKYLNDTSIDGATVNATVTGGGTHDFTYDSGTETYNLTLNITEMTYIDGIMNKIITVEAWKYGYDPLIYNFSWNITHALTDFYIVSPSFPQTTEFGHNLTVRVNYSVHTPFIANISQAAITVSVGAFGPYSLHYNDTSDLWEIQLNSSDYSTVSYTLEFEASKNGYLDYLDAQGTDIEVTWTIDPADNVELLYYFNATNMGLNNHWNIYKETPLNLTILYNETDGYGGISGANKSATIKYGAGTIFHYDNDSFVELGGGYYQLLINDSLIADRTYEIQLHVNKTNFGPITLTADNAPALYVNETTTNLTCSNTGLNDITWQDSIWFNVTYNDTYWNELLNGATIWANKTVIDFSEYAEDGKYNVTIPLNVTNLQNITQAGLWNINISAKLENRSMTYCIVQLNITGHSNLTISNNTLDDNAIIGADITTVKNITTYRNENATLFLFYNSTDFVTPNLTGLSGNINHNWTNNIFISEIGTNGTYMLKFNTTGFDVGYHNVSVNISTLYYELQFIDFQVYIWEKHVTNITVITEMPGVLLAGTEFTFTVRIFDETDNEFINEGTVTFTVSGTQTQVDLNGTGYANVTFTVGTTNFEISVTFSGTYATNIAALTPITVTVRAGGIDPTLVIIIVIIVLAVSIGGTVSAVVVRQRHKHAQEKTKARKKKVIGSVTDVANIKHIVVTHKGSGIDIFEYQIEKGIDSTLLSGFLQAVKEFGKEFAFDEDEELDKVAKNTN